MSQNDHIACSKPPVKLERKIACPSKIPSESLTISSRSFRSAKRNVMSFTEETIYTCKFLNSVNSSDCWVTNSPFPSSLLIGSLCFEYFDIYKVVYHSVARCNNGNHNRSDVIFYFFLLAIGLEVVWVKFCRRAQKTFSSGGRKERKFEDLQRLEKPIDNT